MRANGAMKSGARSVISAIVARQDANLTAWKQQYYVMWEAYIKLRQRYRLVLWILNSLRKTLAEKQLADLMPNLPDDLDDDDDLPDPAQLGLTRE